MENSDTTFSNLPESPKLSESAVIELADENIADIALTAIFLVWLRTIQIICR